MQRRVTSNPRGVSLQAGLPQQLPVHGRVFLLDVPLQVAAVVAGDPRLTTHNLAQGLVGCGLESEILSNRVHLISPHGLNDVEPQIHLLCMLSFTIDNVMITELYNTLIVS